MAKLEALPKRIRLDEGRIILHKIRYNPPHRYAGKVNRNWHVTFNIARGYRKIISTQTPILSKAKQFARNKANELEALHSQGFNIKGENFELVAKKSIQANKLKFQRRDQLESWKSFKSMIENYWIDVFGKTRLINIRTKEIKDEVDHLIRQGLSVSSVKKYLMALKWCFQQAVDERKLNSIPEFPSLRGYTKQFKQRPSFTEDEWKKFNAVLKDFDQDLKGKITGGNHGLASGDLKHQMYYRRALRDWCQLIAYTGLRTGEASLLKWKDWKIENKGKENELAILQVRAEEKKGSKTGEREVVGLSYANTTLERRKKDTPFNKPNDYIFSHIKRHEGKPIMKFRKTFDKALEKAKIGFDDKGNKIKGYSPYMLRGTYATLRLTLGNVDIYKLAKNLGNQVATTEKYYSKARPSDFKESLGKIKND